MNHLLDTCVLSELVKGAPNEGVLDWIAKQDEDALFLSVLTLGELEKGIEKLTGSRRKTALFNWLHEDLPLRFEGRILSIDLAITQRWGLIVGASERKGRPLPVIDSLIAATASVHNLSVVSRNVSDFEKCGVACMNPWQPE